MINNEKSRISSIYIEICRFWKNSTPVCKFPKFFQYKSLKFVIGYDKIGLLMKINKTLKKLSSYG